MAPPRNAAALGANAVMLCWGVLPSLFIGTQAAAAATTPLAKVVELLDGMVSKAKEEKHQEALQYAAYEQFCTNVEAEKTAAITKGEGQVTSLQADVQKHSTDAARLGTEITGHAAEMSSLAGQQEAAKVVRDGEHRDYLGEHQNLTESVNALSKAVNVLKSQNYEREGFGPTALLEAKGLVAQVPEASQVFAAFLARGPGDSDDLKFVPEVPTTAYKPKSGEIITMLEKLHEDFKGELIELGKTEVQNRHTFDTLKQDLLASSKAEETAKDSKTLAKAKAEQNFAEASNNLADVSATLADDKKYLLDLTTTCQKKADEFSSRVQIRADELAALAKAIEILKRDEIAGTAAKHLPAAALVMLRRHSSSAYVQVAHKGHLDPNQMKAVEFLKMEASKLDSHALSALVLKAQDDPFGKVKQLIGELIERLMHQANAEAEHKGWCDTELATNAHTRTTKTETIEMLSAEIDELNASVAQLGKDLGEVSAAISELTTTMANATTLRNNEKAENAVTVAEAQNATAAVTSAITVLTDFYTQAKANSTKFVQQQVKGSKRQAPPPIFQDGSYAGQQDATNGVLGMLDVIKSDFQRLEADTTAAETAAQAEYEGLMEDSRISKAQKETDKQHMSKAKLDNEAALVTKGASLTTAETELGLANTEFTKLKPACLETGQTVEERFARRKEEIEALKEALNILSGEDSQLA